MRATILFFIFSLLAITNASAKNTNTVDYDGVRYTLNTDSKKHFVKADYASCRIANSSNLVRNLIIRSEVEINGKIVTVTEIEKEGFKNCKNLLSITIPNTVIRIGANAFKGCKSLEEVIMPDDASIELSNAYYGYGGKGPFAGCINLVDVKGNTIAYPAYVLNTAFIGCEDVPFYDEIPKLSTTMGDSNLPSLLTSKGEGRVSFKDYAIATVKDPIEQWQKRKEYESTAQWRERVTEETRKAKIEELVDVARTNYIKYYAPNRLYGMIGTYDADYCVFPIETVGDLGTIYVKVPIDEAPDFKKNWQSVELIPTYGIVDNDLAVVSCRYRFGDKYYDSPNTYRNDNIEDLSLNLAPIEITIPDDDNSRIDKTQGGQRVFVADQIDKNIPSTGVNNSRTFVVIIGNENYQRVVDVPYAVNDAKIFAKYCNKTLGIPTKNIRSYLNATYGDMLAAVKDITDIAKVYKGNINIMFYYAGHGMPDEKSRTPYLLPVDASDVQTGAWYSLNGLCNELGSVNAQSVVLFLDACFSGSARGEKMITQARGIRIKPKELTPLGNMVVFSATTGNQTAFPYNEKGHGFFTYYLLEKLQESKGDVTLGTLYDYISTNVAEQSVVVNRRVQIPTVIVAPNVTDKWENIKLR